MNRAKAHLIALGLVAGLAVAGCSNTRENASSVTVVKTLIESRKAKRAATPKIDERIVQLQVQQALKLSDGPLALMRVSKTGSVALLRVIETNGSYSTWSAWGTTERRSITTRGGVITATRGLGSDLMSSNVNRLLPMVSSLGDGIERQVLRHLDGNNQIAETVGDCAFTPDQTERFQSGELNVLATRIDVFCKTDNGRFNNYYLVTRGGRIVESRTWLGENLGYLTFSHLR